MRVRRSDRISSSTRTEKDSARRDGLGSPITTLASLRTSPAITSSWSAHQPARDNEPARRNPWHLRACLCPRFQAFCAEPHHRVVTVHEPPSSSYVLSTILRKRRAATTRLSTKRAGSPQLLVKQSRS